MQKLKQYRWWIVLIVSLIFAFFLSSQNGIETVQTSMFVTNSIVRILEIIGIKVDPENLHLKVRLCAHFVVYIAVGFILCKTMLSARPRRPIIKAECIGCLVGILDEAHKAFIPGRCCDVSEIFINCLCVTVVCIVMYLRNRTGNEKKYG